MLVLAESFKEHVLKEGFAGFKPIKIGKKTFEWQNYPYLIRVRPRRKDDWYKGEFTRLTCLLYGSAERIYTMDCFETLDEALADAVLEMAVFREPSMLSLRKRKQKALIELLESKLIVTA